MVFAKKHEAGRKTVITAPEPETPPTIVIQQKKQTWIERKKTRGPTNSPVERFNNVHHCPKCRKVPTAQCHEQNHYQKCPIHGLPHSQFKACVQCTNIVKVQTKAERESKEAAEKAKKCENEKTMGGFLTPLKERTKARTKKTENKKDEPQ